MIARGMPKPMNSENPRKSALCLNQTDTCFRVKLWPPTLRGPDHQTENTAYQHAYDQRLISRHFRLPLAEYTVAKAHQQAQSPF